MKHLLHYLNVSEINTSEEHPCPCVIHVGPIIGGVVKMANYGPNTKYTINVNGDNFTIDKSVECPPNDEIWYTTTDNQISKIKYTNTLGLDDFSEVEYVWDELWEYAAVGDTLSTIGNLRIVSHTYSNGKGILKMSGNIESVYGCTIDTDYFTYKCCIFDTDRLQSITFPNTIINLGVSSFSHNSFEGNTAAISSITIPSSVTHIGEEAICEWENLSEIICNPTTPPSLGARVFDRASSECKIKVPAQSVDAYKTATNWSVYADKIISQ